MALSERRERFVQEFLVDLNATQAAIRAGYSPKTASEQGARLLTNVRVRSAINTEKKARTERTAISADRVLRELARLAFADLRQAVEWGPASIRLKASTGLDDDTAAAIAEVTKTKDGLRVKLHPKLPALEMLARHLALYEIDSRVDPREIARKIQQAHREMVELNDVPSPFVEN